MKKITLSFLFLFSVFVAGATSVNINVPAAGTLQTTLTDAGHTLSDITELTLSGEIDATDFKVMRDNLTQLSVLDISQVKIKAYMGPNGTFMPMDYPYAENAVPDYAFFNFLFQTGKATLTSVTIGQEIIEQNAFYCCTGLSSLTLLDGVKSIKSSAFGGVANYDIDGNLTSSIVNKLTNIVIPKTVESIEKNAFVNCLNAESLTFASGSSLKTLNQGVVPNKVASVTIPASVNSVVSEALLNFEGVINVEDENPYYSALEGVLYNKDMTKLIQAPLKTTIREIPETVKIISSKAFYKNLGLGVLRMASSVDSIASNSFYGSSLTKLLIDPDAGLRVLENYAISSCKSMTSLTIPSSVQIIKATALAYNTSLKEIYCYIENPLTITANVFDGIDKDDCVLYVPENSIDLYKGADVWSTFQNIEKIALSNEFYITEFAQETGTFMPSNISSNGTYLVGNGSYGAYLWNLGTTVKDNLDIIRVGAEEAHDVTDDKLITGIYKDGQSNKKYAGIWTNGVWNHLGPALVSPTSSNVPVPAAITNDGKTVVGSSYVNDNYTSKAYSWTLEDGVVSDETVWQPDNMPGGVVITSISADGSVACGWAITTDGGSKKPIIWTSPTNFEIIDDSKIGECLRVSDNGKYIAMRYNSSAAIYNVETKEINIIRKDAYCTDVSDTGIAVGYYYYTDNVRKAFVWADKVGAIDFSDYLAVYAKDVVLPAGVDFSPSAMSLDQLINISPDGKTLVGWTGLSQFMARTFVLKMSEIPVMYERPKNLVAKPDLAARTKVNLSWEAPENAEGYTIQGYKIYRDSKYVNTVAASVFTYEDDVTADYSAGGNVSYAVSAVYETDIETPKTETAIVTIINSYQIPFVDDFEYENITTNFWSLTPRKSGIWYIDTSYPPNGYQGVCASYKTEGDGKNYSELFISKPFDATELENVYVSYLATILPKSDLKVATDTLYTEIRTDFDTDDWKVLKKYPLKDPENMDDFGNWSFEEFDLTDVAAGKLFQIRFRAEGNSSLLIYIEIDNFQVRATKEEEIVKEVRALKLNDNKVYLTWQRPSETYGLTYLDGKPRYTVNTQEGDPLIAANLIETEELKLYKGLYLTSISACLNTAKNISVPAELKLAVFEGTERVCSQDILYFESLHWNTYQLDNPILITGDKPLYVGIEIVSQERGDYPLYTGGRAVNLSDGKGNLFSDDHGETWNKLSDYLTIGQSPNKMPMPYNWCIMGNFSERDVVFTENFEDIWGYEVLRDGVSITDTLMIFPQTFVDEIQPDENPSYSIRAYSSKTGWSALSEPVTPQTVSIGKITTDSSISVYPNPVTDKLKINGISETVLASIVDMNGKVLYTGRVSENDFITIEDLQPGTYILYLKTSDDSVKEVKILKK